MVQWAIKRISSDGSKFDVYRCRVEYPVIPSSVVVQFDLPEKPTMFREVAPGFRAGAATPTSGIGVALSTELVAVMP
jgi:hypothetical protein